MKIIHSFFILSFFIPLVSCEDISEFDHFTISNTFEESFSFSIDSLDLSNSRFDELIEFDIANDDSLSIYVNQVTDYKITNLGFKITSFEGNTNAKGSGQFAIISNGINIGSVEFIALNFANLYSSGAEYKLNLPDAVILAIKNALLEEQIITMEVSGNVSSRPIDEVGVTVFMTVEARVEL